MSVARRRIAVVAAMTAIAIPLSLAAAGSASAAESPLDGLAGITGITDGVTGGGDLPVGGLLGGVTGGDTDELLKDSPAAGLTKDLPLAGDPLASVTGLLGEGGLEKTLNGLPIVGPVLDGLGVTGLVGDLVDTVTGVVGGVLGTDRDHDRDRDRDRDRDHDRGGRGASHNPVRYENTALPHTGGDADMTALLMCAGLAAAGTGVTLVSRRRRAGALAG